MVFTGSPSDERFEASANGTRVRLTRDLGRIAMDLDDVERIDLAALDGRDTLLVNDLTGTDLQELQGRLALTQGTDSPDTATTPSRSSARRVTTSSTCSQSGGTVSVLGASAFVSSRALAVA